MQEEYLNERNRVDYEKMSPVLFEFQNANYLSTGNVIGKCWVIGKNYKRERQNEMNAIFHRTSIRQFEDRPVEAEKIEQILRAAMQAPTAVNQQNWEFYVVENKDVIKQLSKTSPYAGCAANAPAAIVVTYRDGGILEMYNDIDCAIASENIWLETDSLGLGTVMLGIAPFEDRMTEVGKILNLPEDVHAFAIFPIGYPAKVAEQQSRFNENKVHYIK